MILAFEERRSDCPYIARVWRSRSDAGGPFLSIAQANLELVVTRLPDLALVTVRGPETRPTVVQAPPNGRWVAIRFAPGVYMPRRPTATLMDHASLNLAVSYDGRFWLDDASWPLPDYDNAEVFVARLVRHGVVVRDPDVAAVVQGDHQALARRTLQRRFQRALGMSHTAFRQIERARHAADLLQSGRSILDAAYEAGYFDQAHLTRALRGLIGQTPARILRQEQQLSFLYKTDPPAAV